MKKVFLTFLIIAILAMSVSAFAAGETYKFAGTASNKTVSAGEEFTVDFALTKIDDAALDSYNMEGATNTVKFSFNNSSFELVELASFLYGYTLDTTTSTKLVDANANGLFAANGSADADFDFSTSAIVSLKFKAKDTASAGDNLELSATTLNFVDADGEWELLTEEVDSKIVTVTVKGSTPIPVVVNPVANTTITTKDTTYTDVVNFSSSLTNVTATNPTLTFDLYENGAKHKSYEVNLGDGVTLTEGTLNFKIAIFGAPTDKTITLVNPAVK